jgi:hypothetical protein
MVYLTRCCQRSGWANELKKKKEKRTERRNLPGIRLVFKEPQKSIKYGIGKIKIRLKLAVGVEQLIG